MPRCRPLVALLPAATALASAPWALAAPVAPPFDLYEAGPREESAFGPAAGHPGPWITLKQETARGRRWVLLALPDGRAGGDLPGIGRPRYLGRVRPGERVVFAAPAGKDGDRLRSGRSVTVAPSGGSVLVTREAPEELARRAHAGFHVLTRSVPLAEPRAPGPPAGMVPILDRVRTVEARQGPLRTREDVQAVIDLVDSTSLRLRVEGLSLDGGTIPTSRWWADNRTETVKADSIKLWLRDALGSQDLVWEHSFEWDGRTVHNIVGKHPSANPNAGAYLVTGHYDAIGVRSDPNDICAAGLREPGSGCDCSADSSVIDQNPACRWDPDFEPNADPAPGADDNGTGIAAMIETARVLSGVAFDFDIYYVAFQVEELGLIGSAAFVDSIVGDSVDQEIFGVFNLDMIGYAPETNQIDVLTNESSEWFADWIVESAEGFLTDFPATKVVTGFGRSDHASFWNVGIDAIHLFEENVGGSPVYPEYHTFRDLWENTFPDSVPDQFLRATQLCVATLARFALHFEAPDLAIPKGEVSARPALGPRLEAGRDVVLQARVHNFGTPELIFQGATVESLTARVRFFDGDPDAGGRLIAEQTRKTFFASGGIELFEARWETEPGQEGFHEIHAVVEGLDPGYAQIEIDRNNNRSSVEIFLRGSADAGPRVLAQYAYPNPVRGDVSRLNFYYELTNEAEVVIEIFDLEGTSVGVFADEGPESDAGANRITGDLFVDNRGDPLSLQSGVYAYVLRVSDGVGSNVTDRQKGKFALLR